MDFDTRKELKLKANEVRRGVVEAVHSAKSGHPGGSLSVSDTLTYLYFKEMNIDPKDPHKQERDRLVLSKGHTCPALYSTLSLRGFFPHDELLKLRKVGAMLQGHPDMKGTPGVDMSSGSLGQGISTACGMALGAKLKGEHHRIYTVLGDGELQEGQVWEAAMFAGAKKLDNLCAVVDNNGLQIDGRVTEVNNPEPITDKFAAFGWHVVAIDGHNFDEIEKAFNEAKATKGQPTVIVQKTIKGKGISFMEDQASWHGAAPNDEQFAQAMSDLDAIRDSINKEAK